MSAQPYTVVGYWDEDDAPISVGVIEGDHPVGGGLGHTEGGDWATVVWTDKGMETAEWEAIEEMQELGPKEDEDGE